MHKIEKISADHWVIDNNKHIRYSDSFGHSGWYYDQGKHLFPPVKDSFLEALEEAIGSYSSKKTVSKPAGS